MILYAFDKTSSKIGYLKYSYPNDISGKRNLQIDYIWVLPENRRSGVALSMINQLLDKYPDVTWVSLWTGTESEEDDSHRLFIKAGFADLTYQKDYYAPGVGSRLYARRGKNNG